mmetsp:Transcript_84257/g.153876  ORF Transcript_84257/g.153876 Transcript_84257/m.153876 type:complete len:243 (-) Transcript_84257:46-774(-)
MPGVRQPQWGAARKDCIDDGQTGLLGKFLPAAWTGRGADDYGDQGMDEEKQGLLGRAQQGLQNVAEKAVIGASGLAGGRIGTFGNMGAAMQVATISRQRWMAFFVLLGIGLLLMALSFASLPLILLAPHKFSVVFTTGSLCIMGALSALKGVGDFATHLMSSERLPLSIGYCGSIIGTLWATHWYQSTLLSMVFSFAQMIALIWFFVSYIPGGPTVLGFISDAFCGVARRACCGGKSGSLPI